MKLLINLAFGILLIFSSCATKKSAPTVEENFRISQMHLDAAKYMDLTQTQRDEYFEIFKNTERYLKTMAEQELEKHDKIQRLREIRILQEERLKNFFNPEDYIKHKKFLLGYKKSNLDQIEPKLLKEP